MHSSFQRRRILSPDGAVGAARRNKWLERLSTVSKRKGPRIDWYRSLSETTDSSSTGFFLVWHSLDTFRAASRTSATCLARRKSCCSASLQTTTSSSDPRFRIASAWRLKSMSQYSTPSGSSFSPKMTPSRTSDAKVRHRSKAALYRSLRSSQSVGVWLRNISAKSLPTLSFSRSFMRLSTGSASPALVRFRSNAALQSFRYLVLAASSLVPCFSAFLRPARRRFVSPCAPP
mmetsp:Transcript_5580/g.15701  ORF Transcript_5580/g.15701 Transcript_5580/m.15701 type:complete len:232 (-) Transcript_5580:77-772(-)